MFKTKNTKSLINRNSAKGSAIMKPQLTSLIDVMTILLVFLLKSFSVEGNLISVSPDMDLAASTSRKAPVPALNVEVTPNNIIVDGKAVMTTAQVMDNDSLMLSNLYTGLKQSAKGRHLASEAGRIIIQCDSAVDFKILKKIMYTCGKAEFSNFSLLVEEKV